MDDAGIKQMLLDVLAEKMELANALNRELHERSRAMYDKDRQDKELMFKLTKAEAYVLQTALKKFGDSCLL